MERERSSSSNNGDDNNNNNGNSAHNGGQTLDHHVHYAPAPQAIKSPMSGSSPRFVRYRECLKNHAASIGGSVYDGCGEFMPSGDEGSIEALKCAACNCHRNFHRKVPDDGGDAGGGSRKTYPAIFPHRETGRRPGVVNMMLSPTAAGGFPFHHHQYGGGPPPPPSGMVTPMSVAYGGGGGVGGAHTESSSEDLNMYGQSSGGDVQQTAVPPFSLGRKRFRTKFTAEQKEKMTEFAEKLGWRMNKQDEEELERFCGEIGVKRQVFKVWMHNNKSNSKKQQSLLQMSGRDDD